MALRHAGPGEKVHLPSASSPDARTTALVKTDRFETAQLVVRAGVTIQPHSVPGYAVIYCIEGSVFLDAGQEIHLQGGDWIYLARDEKHGLRATQDSSLLLTVLFDR
jgi:quercetin dioxygenase-like cupin family protein